MLHSKNHKFASSNFQTLFILLGLSLLWLAMVLIVDPRGEFPLNDDWMYARTVFNLVNSKKYILCDFQAAIAFAQILWGALFSAIFGFSMTILRVSVLVLGWFGILTSYFIFRKSGQGVFVSGMAAVLLATTPFYFILANTFMTNVPFYACVLASVYFLIRWIESETLFDIVWGIIFACLAMLVRQLAVMIPAAFALACITRHGFSKKTILACLACGIAVFGTLFFYHEWLRQTIGIPIMDMSKGKVFKVILHLIHQGFLHTVIWAFFVRLISVLIYLGIFLLPLLVVAVPVLWKRFSLRRKFFNAFIFVAMVLISAGSIMAMGKMMPILGVYIFDFGIGPLTISNPNYLYKAPPLFWFIVTTVGVMSSAALIMIIADTALSFFKDFLEKRDVKKHWLSVFCISACGIHFFPFGLSGHFDLYLAAYIPFLILFILGRTPVLQFAEKRFYFFGAGVLMALLAYFSIAGAHDYLSWNRARWDGLFHIMQKEKVSAAQIDGGYEFNGWFLYDPRYKKIPGRSWWWVEDDQYIASFGLKTGYVPHLIVPYKLWLPPWKGRIVILKRLQDKVERDYSQALSVYQMQK